MSYECRTINNFSDFLNEEANISSINTNADMSCIFADFQWLKKWWEEYSKPSDQLCIPIFYTNNRLVGFSPTYLKDGKKLMWIGTGGAEASEICPEYLDVITINTFQPSFLIKPFKEWLALLSIKEVFLIHCLKKSLITQCLTSFKASYVTHVSTTGLQHYLDVENGTQHCIEKTKSKSFKKKLTKLNCALQHDLALDVKYIDNNSNEFEDSFNLLKKIHTKKWNSKGETGAFSNDLFNQHHLNVFNDDYDIGPVKKKVTRQVLCVISLEGKVIGISYCLLSKNKCHYYQSGIEDNVSHAYSPGHLLHVAMMRYCTENKIRYYDFMRGKVSGTYKDSYSALTKTMCNLTSYKTSIFSLPNIAITIARNVKYRNKNTA